MADPGSGSHDITSFICVQGSLPMKKPPHSIFTPCRGKRLWVFAPSDSEGSLREIDSPQHCMVRTGCTLGYPSCCVQSWEWREAVSQACGENHVQSTRRWMRIPARLVGIPRNQHWQVTDQPVHVPRPLSQCGDTAVTQGTNPSKPS